MFSIIILTRNRLAQLKNLLAALKVQEEKDFEVIVIDTGSTDGTREYLRDLQKKTQMHCERFISLEFSPEQGGFAEARNLGIKYSKGEYVVFIDDDCTPPADWLKKISAQMKNYDAIGGATLPPADLKFPTWWSGELNWLVGLMPIRRVQDGSVIYPQTANLALRRSVALKEPFQELGKTFGTQKKELEVYWAGREDAELWWRLRIKGYRTLFDPNIFVYHHISPERFRVVYLVRRAFRDGYVFFLRQRQKGYLSVALYQLFDVITRVARQHRQGMNFKSALIQESLWTVRQLGFIYAYLNEEQDYFQVLRTGLRRFADYILATAKNVGRTIFVSGYRLARPRKRIPVPPKKSILLVCAGYVGDFVIIQPAIRALRRALPENRLLFLCNKPGQDLYNIPDSPLLVDKIITLPEDQSRQKQLIAELLVNEELSATLIFYGHFLNCKELFLNRRTPAIISFSDDVGFPRRLWYDLLDRSVEKDFTQNEILNHIRLVSILLENPEGLQPEKYSLQIPESVQEKVNGLLRNFSSDTLLIGINPGTALAEKRWCNEHWAELIHLINQRLINAAFVLLGDRNEKDTIENIVQQLDDKENVLNLAGKTPHLLELAGVIERLHLIITTDSGVKHLAFALGTPSITLYGASDERRWGAFWDTELHKAVRVAPVDLTRDELLGFPVNHQMRLITPQVVFTAFEELATCLKII